MSSPPPALVAALQAKCPHCRRGPLFRKGPYSPDFLRMHNPCLACGHTTEPEPGFYWGAMYVNYAFVVGLFLATVLGWSVWGPADSPIWLKMAVYLGIVLVLLPLLTRYSRVAMLYLFGGIRFSREAWAQK